MSFATDVRGELARQTVTDACCARSELAAVLKCSTRGIAWRGRNRYAVTITASEAPTVRRYFAMLKQFYGIIGQIRTLSGDTLNNQTRYQLVVPEEDALRLLDDLRLLDESAPFGLRAMPDEEIVRFACCKKAFVRGAFLARGEVNPPDKQYHFEITLDTEALAGFIADQLKYFEINVKSTCRKSKYVVYLKRAEEISDALSLLGASGSMLAFENVRVNKEVSNRVNRQLNCDNSNINRAVSAAESQICDIRYIEAELGLEKLPATLRDMAIARANNPEMPLAELGEHLNPPLGKSGVSARLRRLTAIADKLRSGDEITLK